MSHELYFEQDGDIGIDWSTGEGDVLSISLRGDGRIGFAVLLADGRTAQGGAQLAPEAFELLAKLIPAAEELH